jgi:site-specific DNA-adenine methylase
MKNLYGMPYMGSKTKIALDILKQLPKGERFVDLFGGGFAMSHAAVLSGRYNSVLYNDFNTLLVRLIRDAISGKYNYNNFKPEFVTREMFENLKDVDGYVKYIWSFGNKGDGYLYGKEIEPYKQAAHNFIVFGKWNNLLNDIVPRAYNYVTSNAIPQRRLQFCQYAKKMSDRRAHHELQHLEQLERLQRLQQLQRLEQLERLQRLQQLQRLEQLEITNIDYKQYQHKDGDIVYLDPPYESTAEYGQSFDHKAFYDWVYTRPYQVWFSSYKISDNRFKMVWAKRLRGTLGGAKNDSINFECLYTNK